MEKQSLEEQLLHPLEQKRDQNAGTRKNKQIIPFMRTHNSFLTDYLEYNDMCTTV